MISIYYVVPDKVKNLWLLASSYYFYMCWNVKYALLILISTVITYLSGLLLETVKKREMSIDKRQKFMKLIIALSFVLNLGILFYAREERTYTNLVPQIEKMI